MARLHYGNVALCSTHGVLSLSIDIYNLLLIDNSTIHASRPHQRTSLKYASSKEPRKLFLIMLTLYAIIVGMVTSGNFARLQMNLVLLLLCQLSPNKVKDLDGLWCLNRTQTVNLRGIICRILTISMMGQFPELFWNYSH